MLLIDAIGPFFRHYKPKRINWSKIPFHHLECADGLKPEVLESVPRDFESFCEKAQAFGYDGITLDDVAHLARFDRYSPRLSAKIEAYRELFRSLFAIAKKLNLRVFITTDIAFFSPELYKELGNNNRKINSWLSQRFDELFRDFPEIDGIVTRFGETDGLDVHGDFRSRLVLKRPQQAREFLKTILPVFERHQRLLIFRTWSVGAYQVGDMTWNPRTFDRVFANLDSPQLVISMKYGESDFFRFLPTNPLFFVSDHKKIIEFQARREYEGFGAYPSFVGFDSQAHFQSLSRARNIIGASVWCQTGGWGKRRQITFVRNSSPWVELNAFVIPRIFKGDSCSQALRDYCDLQLQNVDPAELERFLRLSDEVIGNLLYIREFAERRLFFRRLRLPPQAYVFWDRIIVDDNVRTTLACLVQEPERALREADQGIGQLRQMIELARQSGIPTKGLGYQLNTFTILSAARSYYFGSDSTEAVNELMRLKGKYGKKYKRNYSIEIRLGRSRFRSRQVRLLLTLLLRQNDRYRLIDHLVTLRLLAWAYPVLKHFAARISPKFANKQAMGIDALFK